MKDDEINRLAMESGLMERIDLTRSDWPPALRAFASLIQSAERERCAQYLRDAAARLAPEGKRVNQIDRHTARVLACKGDELAAGYAWRDTGMGEQK